jgi:hypothetical protein
LLAGLLDDLHSFDPATKAWTLLAAAAGSSFAPSARYMHGFTSLAGKLYVHGGSCHVADDSQGGNANDGVGAERFFHADKSAPNWIRRLI